MNTVNAALETLAAGTGLSIDESRAVVGALLDGGVADTSVAALLTALRLKGETADELEGAVAALRERMIRFESRKAGEPLLDTCGTGGDGANTVNISTAAAVVTAACGISVVKHGNRAATGRSGSSDVLSALGVAADVEPDLSRVCLAELKIAFLFAPRFHPGMAHVAPVRRQLPFRTIFNLVGPLCNPALPSHQLVGVPNEPQARLIAEVFARQPHTKRAAVLTGWNGLDEVTLDGPTWVFMIESGDIHREEWTPSDFGLSERTVSSIKGGDPAESARRLSATFAGEPGPVRDYILASSAAALYVAEKCSLRDGVARAAVAIDTGAVSRLIERWRKLAPV
jgi:anthranilate phosphoribosyltransferase